jgi:hypothetical protein
LSCVFGYCKQMIWQCDISSLDPFL